MGGDVRLLSRSYLRWWDFLGGVNVIFIVLGTQKFQFNRLLKLLDKLIEENKIKDSVFAQIGHSDYTPKHYAFTDFLDKDNFEKKIQECDVLITHSGVGTIISGVNNNKPTIVVPRLKKFNEHVDDHQCEIANAFAKKKLVLLYEENDKLEELINKSEKFKYEKYISNKNKINSIILKFIEDNK